ncbi:MULTISPECIES: GDSL-type esterase/lipase family protein [Pacificibacter]|uniref:GDSL-type esterase/lipase family protein n=1 Tax=Pacificibacter TaxID=1042323 RepID=UPI001C08ECA2|nr:MULTISPECIES: GDSL-type esterase/lipase family protein [Pacificibacter]MBU2936804.1 hypothetical protein [Pacificibacter marinus]MDO6614796.1 GDSL-type esterase/lipase family protein [Pacificibacter sp. 1_MG-2023]
MTDFQHMDDVAAMMAQLDRRDPIDGSIVFYGSSTFKNWKRLAEDMNNLDVVNAGFGGGTFEGAMQHFERVFDAVTPKMIVVYFGENDIASDGFTAEETLDLHKAFHTRVRERFPTIPVIYLPPKTGIIRWIWHPDYVEYSRLVEKDTQNDPNAYFADVGVVTLGSNGRPATKFFERDGIHIGPKGYAAWTPVIKAAMAKAGLK